MPTPEWWDDLHEGIVLLQGDRVASLNRAAAERLGVSGANLSAKPLLSVLRDHRIEAVWRSGVARTVTIRGRRTEVRRIAGGLALRDVEAERRAQEDARDLLAVLSHELRTPATTIASALHALSYPDLSTTERREWTERAESEAQRLVRLLHDLAVDVRPPRERTVRVAEVAERARLALAPTLRRHDVRLRVDDPVGTLWADPDKLLQVVVNLVENAAVHGPDGEEVTVAFGAEADGDLTVAVRDRGAPLAAEVVERLFDPYQRGAKPGGSGTGLGLYVVRSIAERAGGRAFCEPWTMADGDRLGNAFGARWPQRPGDEELPAGP